MSKHILIIATSLRPRSNSDALADAFLAGAESAGHAVEKVSLKGKSLAFCRGCMACQQTGACPIPDDVPEVLEKMRRADVIVFATPIYYYEMCGQMKTLLDRANPLYGSNYSFRDIYFLATAAEDLPEVPHRAISGLQGWIDCFEKAALAGSVFAGGVNEQGEITGHPALQTAYTMGASV
ncbi:MAG TPA: flavodoxin family protein [Candidatus Faecousia intestinigallinarum]|nr:flavodoxin family protein [Candidatus Faecousia intestinigallinarum]